MPKAILPSNIEIEYDTFGNKNSKPLLLVMGLGAQMIAWRDAWCELLAQQGFFVIRFDNRDVGLSSYMDHIPLPKAKDFFQATFLRKKSLRKQHLKKQDLNQPINSSRFAHYYLKDMAEDAIGLMNHLGLKQAHVCGASMGGMIAQEMAIHFPDRVQSLCLIMTTPGDRRLPKPALRVMLSGLRQPSPKNLEKSLKHQARHLQVIGSVKELAHSIEDLKAHVKRLHLRQPSRHGAVRQTFAIMKSPNRSKALKKLSVPTLIIHGEADPLVKVEHAYALKALMPHARFELVKNMGHDIPSPLYASFAKMIAELAQAK